MAIDVNDWTMKELADLESLSGQSMTLLADDDAPKARLMTAMAFIHLRRTDPKIKYGQVERMGLAEIQEILGIDDVDDDQEQDDDDPKDYENTEPETSQYS